MYGDNAVNVVTEEELTTLESSQIIDEPGGRFQRTGSSTTFTSLLAHYPAKDPSSSQLATLVHEIEIDAWSQEVSLEAGIVENAFRNMQLLYGRSTVGKTCYLQFFDNVVALIETDGIVNLPSPKRLIPDKACLTGETKKTKISTRVPTLPLEKVLALTSTAKKPLFLDTRETWEFEEGHIPGAINMKLREINSDSAQSLSTEHTVIAYCVKDFRGYEAARKLRSYGINAVIMTPHGMRGWIEAKLPVAGTKGEAESAALSELQRIAQKSSNVIAPNVNAPAVIAPDVNAPDMEPQ